MDGKILSHPGLTDPNIPMQVAEIMDRDWGVWDLENIECWISEVEWNVIESIPICQQGGKDELVLPYCQGAHTVKSEYQLLKQERI